MLIYIAKRALLAASVVLAVLVATFVLFFVGPNDPARAICGDRKCTADRLQQITTSLGLDKPKTQQFQEYFTGLFVGRELKSGSFVKECSAPCLGYSFRNDTEVKSEIAQRFPNTVVLALGAVVVFLLIGIPSGVFAGRRRGTAADKVMVTATQIIGAVPYYIVALLFYLYVVVLNPILPGWQSRDTVGTFGWLQGFIAPWLLLGIVYATSYTRYTRASMIDTLSQDYIRTARSKGISEQKVVYKHGLRAALSPVVTILGMDVAGLLSGTLVTEKIYRIDGIGRLSIQSLNNEDLPMIMGTVLVSALLVVVMNLLVDIAYSFVDPRVRLQ